MADEQTQQEFNAAEARKKISALEAERDKLSATVKDLGARDIAVEYFRQAGVADPFAAADIALPHIRNAEGPDAMRETLGAKFQGIFPTTPTEPPASTEPVAATESTATPPVPVPSPATPGGTIPVQPQVHEINAPEVQAMIRQGNDAAVRQMYEQGQLNQRYQDPVAPKSTG